MSINNINIQALEKQFDALLASFDETEIREWYRFDIEQDKLERFMLGEFQSTEISEVVFSSPFEKPTLIMEIEVFDYILDEAC